jgi:SAM-dependent methyltransferase
MHPPSPLSLLPLPPRQDQPRELACKVCQTLSPRYTATDFARCCSREPWSAHDPVGIPVIYYRCPGCQLVFTGFFDSWTPEDFVRYVYNDGYTIVDGESLDKRPREIAAFIDRHIPKRDIRILDYGGGSGVTADFLRAAGYTDVTVYEPFDPRFAAKPDGVFDFLLCNEVLEHTTDPKALVRDLARLSAERSLGFISTLTQNAEFEQRQGEHWYIAPRNGHTHFHSLRSLALCFEGTGLRLSPIQSALYAAFRDIPDWAKHLFAPGFK